jgi:ElaB/YqjD/DUF883 family membrane-anchored ribosome-binding protein
MDTLKESQPSLSQATHHALQNVQEATEQTVLVPLAQGALNVVETVESGGEALAASTSFRLGKVEAWAERHPTRMLGVSFGIGMLAGLLLFRR